MLLAKKAKSIERKIKKEKEEDEKKRAKELFLFSNSPSSQTPTG